MYRTPLVVLASLLVCLFAAGSVTGSGSAYVSIAGHTRGSGWIQAPASRPAPEHRRAAHVIAYVRSGDTVAVRSRPFGPVLERIGATTQFGSPRALAVLRTQRGRWLAVTQPELGNGRLGWVDAAAGGLRYSRTRLEIEVDLSKRTLEVRRGSVVLRRVAVGVGRSGSPTPAGRFAVTDKLDGASYSAVYGCCILALSATQPNLPAGWSGGNRIAIHGTPNASDFGHAVSAGCVHADTATLQYLMRVVPLGTPVVIRR